MASNPAIEYCKTLLCREHFGYHAEVVIGKTKYKSDLQLPALKIAIESNGHRTNDTGFHSYPGRAFTDSHKRSLLADKGWITITIHPNFDFPMNKEPNKTMFESLIKEINETKKLKSGWRKVTSIDIYA